MAGSSFVSSKTEVGVRLRTSAGEKEKEGEGKRKGGGVREEEGERVWRAGRAKR